MKETIDSLKNQFEKDIGQVNTLQDVENLNIKYLGKKGPIQELMKVLKDVSPEERPGMGKWINELKEAFTKRIEESFQKLLLSEESKKLGIEKIDVTLPGRKRFAGRAHLLTAVLDEILDIMISMGFSVQYGPDIDTDYYNYEALNFPPIILLGICKILFTSMTRCYFAHTPQIFKRASWKRTNLRLGL